MAWAAMPTILGGERQTLAAGLTHQHDTTLAAASGYRRHAGQRPQGLMVARRQRPAGLDQQSGADDPPDPRQGTQDRHVALLWWLPRRCLRFLRGGRQFSQDPVDPAFG